MDDRQSIPMNDTALDRGIERALAIDPSPEFLARVRTRLASEPAPSAWRVSWTMCFAGGAVAAAAIGIVTVALNRVNTPVAGAPLPARAIGTAVAMLPSAARPSTTSGRATVRLERGERRSAAFLGPRGAPDRPALRQATNLAPLFDPRETRALQAFIARVGNGRVDLSPLLRPAGPAPMELPRIDELSISLITIDPIAPADGAQGERP